MNWTDHLIRRGWIPDGVIRFQIKRLLRLRLRDEYAGGAESVHDRFRARLALWSQGPIAINMQEANDQHYEVPPAFFQKYWGPTLNIHAVGLITLSKAWKLLNVGCYN